MIASIEGKIVRFENNKCVAVVETQYGEAFADINADHDFRLQIGDEIRIEDASCYAANGRIITVLKDEIWINGTLVTAHIPEGG